MSAQKKIRRQSKNKKIPQKASESTHIKFVLFYKSFAKKHMLGIIKSIITIVGTLIATILIFRFSSGYKSGRELERFLDKKILESYISQTNVQIIDEKNETSSKDTINPFSDDVIIKTGYFKSEGSKSWDIRYIAIFEKEDLSLFDHILNRPSGYELSAKYFINNIESNSTLLPVEAKTEDLNEDGSKEVLIEYKTLWADRESFATILLEKIDNNWRIATIPDLEGILKFAYPEEEHSLFFDEFEFTDAALPKIISVSNGGYYWYLEKDGNIKLFIRAVDWDGPFGAKHATYYFLFTYLNGEFVPDENWNHGFPLRVESDSDSTLDQIIEIGASADMIGSFHFYVDPHIGAINEE